MFMSTKEEKMGRVATTNNSMLHSGFSGYQPMSCEDLDITFNPLPPKGSGFASAYSAHAGRQVRKITWLLRTLKLGGVLLYEGLWYKR